jgi:outer membrane receptor protein involved in Fe transport
LKTHAKAVLQVHKYHEINTGFEYAYHDLENFTYLLSNDTLHPITDEYKYNPTEYSVFLQNNIDYKGLYAKVGCRYDYFSSDIEGIEPKAIISPRIGFSFMVTDRFLFRANIGRYAQPPLYDYMYSYYQLLPWPYSRMLPPVGNPVFNTLMSNMLISKGSKQSWNSRIQYSPVKYPIRSPGHAAQVPMHRKYMI